MESSKVELPKELVLLATVHGGIFIEDNTVDTFVVPEGMKITRIMATRPGICNITSPEQINIIVNEMNESGVDQTDIKKAVLQIKNTQSEVVKNVVGQLKSDDRNRALFEEFIRSRIATPTVKVFNAGDRMLNKMLGRNETEGRNSAFDYKMLALNMPGKPDLFDVLVYGTPGPGARTRSKTSYGREVFLSRVIEDLKARGVEHVIFYDLTCSSFMGDSMDDRTQRDVRRTILQQGWGKRKTRRPKNKTKTRRNKKRTTQWSY